VLRFRAPSAYPKRFSYMSKLMLIDATHPEETRVAVVNNGQIEDFDFEARNKRQLRGNIYLAKVTRVEPSLQAAFVDYGGNRHGFLAFSEIHPDYYQIPKEDREALIAEADGEDVDDEDEDEESEGDEESDEEAERKQNRRNALFQRKYKI
jgi:ribonuclease E